LNSDGTPDLSFGTGGKVAFNTGNVPISAFTDVAIQDSKIIGIGNAPGTEAFARDFGLVRFNGDGTLDATFGGDGLVATHVSLDPHGAAGPAAVEALRDGRIVALGAADGDWVLVFYRDDGSLDTSVSGDGIVRTDFGGGEDALTDGLVQPDGKIVAVGSSRLPGRLELARYLGPPQLPDTTPPLITPHVSGTVGGDGWYTSNVSVSWSVSDPESPLGSETGCDATAVASDTAGLSFTCTAASAGGTASKSVTIKRDATAPTLGCSVTPGRLWPANHKLVVVTTDISVADALSGPAGFSLQATAASDGDPALDIVDWTLGTADTEGLLRAERAAAGRERAYTLTYEGADLAGNSATCALTVTVRQPTH
jgi:uncharacterized delta-60 repeat protein